MKYRTLPQPFLDRIKAEIETIPVLKGKVSLTLEFSSDTSGMLTVMEVKRFSQDQVRI